MLILLILILSTVPFIVVQATDEISIGASHVCTLSRPHFPFLRYPFRPKTQAHLKRGDQISFDTTVLFNYRLDDGRISPRETTSLSKYAQKNNALFNLIEDKGKLLYLHIDNKYLLEVLSNGKLAVTRHKISADTRRYFDDITIFTRIDSIMRSCVARIATEKECILHIGSQSYEIRQESKCLLAFLINKKRGQITPEPVRLEYVCLTLWHRHLAKIKSPDDLFTKPSSCSIS
jgi:hypothetical protein